MGVELLERHPELQLEGLLEEVLGQLLYSTYPVWRGRSGWGLNCWKGTPNSSWKVCWKRYWDSCCNQPTLCGDGGVGGVELLERHPELQLEGLLEEVPRQLL